MKAFVFGFLVALAVVAGTVYFYFKTGRAPVATSAEAMPFEKRLARLALNARVEKEMPKSPPAVQANEENLLAGAKQYSTHCAVCHNLPTHQMSAIALGEFPKPPDLFRGKGVSDDPAAETYWKIANGIRLTGMPGFKQRLSETEMWQIALLLANSNKLPPRVLGYLQEQPQAPQ